MSARKTVRVKEVADTVCYDVTLPGYRFVCHNIYSDTLA